MEDGWGGDLELTLTIDQVKVSNTNWSLGSKFTGLNRTLEANLAPLGAAVSLRPATRRTLAAL